LLLLSYIIYRGRVPDLRINHDVKTFDGRMLLPAGSMLSKDLLNDLISSRSDIFLRTVPFSKYGTVKDDIRKFIRIPPYDSIFNEQRTVAELLAEMDKIHLLAPIFKSFDFFKANDLHSYHHFLMVFSLATRLAKELIPDQRTLTQLLATGPLHDFGKVCVPLHILKKATRLSRRERDILESHSAAGYVLLSYYLGNTKNLACQVARDHHERRDGSGYPRGVRLDDILIEIIAVCDIYDALVSPRPYRAASFDNRAALEEIMKMAEKGKVRWEVVKALVALNRKSKPRYCKINISEEFRGTQPPGNLYGLFEDDDE
jgi:HD-GYP domain-containing protein (c-di-GMP phosphodiesterase class II)